MIVITLLKASCHKIKDQDVIDNIKRLVKVSTICTPNALECSQVRPSIIISPIGFFCTSELRTATLACNLPPASPPPPNDTVIIRLRFWFRLVLRSVASTLLYTL